MSYARSVEGSRSRKGGAEQAPATRTGAPPGLEAATFRLGPDEFAIFSYPRRPVRPAEGLSSAERDVCERLLRGEEVAEIARARGSAVNTVRNQIRTLYRRLRVSSLGELAQMCLESDGGSETER